MKQHSFVRIFSFALLTIISSLTFGMHSSSFAGKAPTPTCPGFWEFKGDQCACPAPKVSVADMQCACAAYMKPNSSNGKCECFYGWKADPATADCKCDAPRITAKGFPPQCTCPERTNDLRAHPNKAAAPESVKSDCECRAPLAWRDGICQCPNPGEIFTNYSGGKCMASKPSGGK